VITMPALSVTTSVNDWRATTLGESCIMYQPKTITRKEMNADGKFPVYGANGVIGRHNEYNHDGPQLVIGCRGTIGIAHITEPKSWINGNAMVIQSKNGGISHSFLRYLFLGGIDISSAISGTAQPQITRKSLSSVEFSYPVDLKEQERIVRILDKTFEEVENRTSQVEQKLDNSKEMFQSVIASIFSQKGEGWTEKTLEEVCENLDRKRIPIAKSKRVSGEIPYYGASGIVDYVKDYIFDDDLLLVSEDGANLLARTFPIAFSISGKTWVNNHAHVLRFDNMATQRFMEYYLNSIRLEPYVSGMAQPKLNQKSLNSIPVPEPPLNQQQAIVNKLDSLSLNVALLEENHRSEIESLVELKQSILHEAFSGRLTGGHLA